MEHKRTQSGGQITVKELSAYRFKIHFADSNDVSFNWILKKVCNIWNMFRFPSGNSRAEAGGNCLGQNQCELSNLPAELFKQIAMQNTAVTIAKEWSNIPSSVQQIVQQKGIRWLSRWLGLKTVHAVQLIVDRNILIIKMSKENQSYCKKHLLDSESLLWLCEITKQIRWSKLRKQELLINMWDWTDYIKTNLINSMIPIIYFSMCLFNVFCMQSMIIKLFIR